MVSKFARQTSAQACLLHIRPERVQQVVQRLDGKAEYRLARVGQISTISLGRTCLATPSKFKINFNIFIYFRDW